MAGTILPVGYGERQRGAPPLTPVLHVLANLVGAAGVGVAWGLLGALLPWHGRPAVTSGQALLGAGLVAVTYSARELGLLPVPVPHLSRQVSGRWRRSFRPRTFAILYGLELGTGITTFVNFTGIYVALVWVALLGNPVWGAIVMMFFGLGRGLPLLWLASRTSTAEEAFHRLEFLSGWKPLAHLASGLVLAMVGPGMVVAVLTHG